MILEKTFNVLFPECRDLRPPSSSTLTRPRLEQSHPQHSSDLQGIWADTDYYEPLLVLMREKFRQKGEFSLNIITSPSGPGIV